MLYYIIHDTVLILCDDDDTVGVCIGICDVYMYILVGIVKFLRCGCYISIAYPSSELGYLVFANI